MTDNDKYDDVDKSNDEIDKRFEQYFTESALVMAYREKIEELEYKIARLEACMAALECQGPYNIFINLSPARWRKANVNPATFNYCMICKAISRKPIDENHVCDY